MNITLSVDVVSDRARQWALNEVSSQKDLVYWPERDKPFPSTYQGWMALPQHFESAEDNADFKGLMARFNYQLDRNITENTTTPELCDGEASGGGIGKNCVQGVDEGAGERSMTIEFEEIGVGHDKVGETEECVSTGKEISEVNEEKEAPMIAEGGNVGRGGGGGKAATKEIINVETDEGLEMAGTKYRLTELETEGIEFLAQKYKGKERCEEGMKPNSDYITDSDDMYSGILQCDRLDPAKARERIREKALIVKGESEGDDSEDEDSGNSTDTDESDDTSPEDEEARTVRRYGGVPGVPSTSSRMNVPAMTKVMEGRVRHAEEIDRKSRSMETAFPEWIHMREVKLHESAMSMRYNAMGVLGRAACDLAELQAMNNIYKDVIVEMMDNIERNKEAMKQIEEARLRSMEHDRVYAEAMAMNRQGSREVSDARTMELKNDEAVISGCLDSGIGSSERRLKKRRLEASEGLLFGRKSEKMAKKLRNNSYLFGGSLNGGEGMSGSRRSSGN